MMYVFVINLEHDELKRAYITRHLKDLGVQFYWFPAVYGKNLKHANFYTRFFNIILRGRLLNNAERGCAKSHLMIYKYIVDNDIDECIILEDDALLDGSVFQIVKRFKNHVSPCKANLLLFTDVEKFYKKNGSEFGVCNVAYYSSSYYLNRNAAFKLYSYNKRIIDVIDSWWYINRLTSVSIYGLTNPIAGQRQDLFGSSTSRNLLYGYRLNISLLWRTVKYVVRIVVSLIGLVSMKFKYD